MTDETKQKVLLAIDEINRLSTEMFDKARTLSDKDRATFLNDTIEELLIAQYVFGRDIVCEMLGIDSISLQDLTNLSTALNITYDGKTFRDRVDEYALNGDYESLQRVIDTETHRMFGQGQVDLVSEVFALFPSDTTTNDRKNITKTWVTMLDDKVRDTHLYLEGETIPFNDRFFSFDGDSAMFPGGFNKVQNNANCRCIVDIRLK